MTEPAGLPVAPLVGVLGGMGPAATADFYAKLVRATPARTDQEHLRVVIWADPTVPDRSAALLHDGEDPAPALAAGARALAAAGATLIAVPCNTAHAFLDGVSRVGVPLVHMIRETALAVASVVPPGSRVGLLATTGTVAAGLYQRELEAVGTEAVLPDERDQDAVMAAIGAVKAGDVDDARRTLVEAARRLTARGARAVVAGCTEIPLALHADDVAVPVVDPATVLAEAVVARVRGRAASG